MDIISRKEAKEQGLKRYFTGVACKRGHLSERRVSGFDCIECREQWEKDNHEHLIESRKRYYEKNNEKIVAYRKEYNKTHSEEACERSRKWYEDNKDKASARNKKNYDENKEQILAHNKAYRDNNKEKLAEQAKESYKKNSEREKARSKKWNEENKERKAEVGRIYREANKERIAIQRKQYRDEHKEESATRGKKWREDNKEHCEAKYRENYEKNQHIYVANAVKRKAVKKQRTPKWLTKQDHKDNQFVFWVARQAIDFTNDEHKYEVDHEIPLQGELVSGLHVPGNLRIMPADENRSKGNKFNPWSFEAAKP